LAKFAPGLKARAGDAAEIWHEYSRGQLVPSFLPTGRHVPSGDRARGGRPGRTGAPPTQGRGRGPGGAPGVDQRRGDTGRGSGGGGGDAQRRGESGRGSGGGGGDAQRRGGSPRGSSAGANVDQRRTDFPPGAGSGKATDRSRDRGATSVRGPTVSYVGKPTQGTTNSGSSPTPGPQPHSAEREVHRAGQEQSPRSREFHRRRRPRR
jgi:RIO kinase 1